MDRAIEVLRTRYERYVARQMRRIFRRMEQELLNLDYIPTMAEAEGIIHRYRHEQEDLLRWLYERTYPDAALLVTPPDVEKALRRGEVKSKLTERIRAWIDSILGAKITRVENTTIERVRAIYNISPDTNSFRENLITMVFHDNAQRSATIARTETTAATNASMRMAADEYSFDRPMMKIWRTRMTLSVRDTHKMMEGVEVGKDELFRVPRLDGGYDLMDFPGDSSHGASAENTVNCRCWCEYRYLD